MVYPIVPRIVYCRNGTLYSHQGDALTKFIHENYCWIYQENVNFH